MTSGETELNLGIINVPPLQVTWQILRKKFEPFQIFDFSENNDPSDGIKYTCVWSLFNLQTLNAIFIRNPIIRVSRSVLMKHYIRIWMDQISIFTDAPFSSTSIVLSYTPF